MKLYKNLLVLKEGEKFMSKHIMIDPGHGGKDSGATGNGYLEKNITLEV